MALWDASFAGVGCFTSTWVCWVDRAEAQDVAKGGGESARPDVTTESSGGDEVHRSVMVSEVLDTLELSPGQIVLDATVGAGGHASSMLVRILPGGRLLGIERDPEMAALARRRLSTFGEAAVVVVANFRDARRVIDESSVPGLDAALFDLGVSSAQIDTPSRGFSFKADGPLDMRLDPSRGRSAAQVLAEIGEADLERALSEYGEERFARRIARAIVEARGKKRLTSTLELREIVVRALGGAPRAGEIDPATRTFQALRILVNDELASLEAGLEAVFDRLKPGGRLAVISFHSLEDRIVKNFFRAKSRAEAADIVVGKPLRPLPEEIARNRRSRSARLRAIARRGG